MTEDMTSPHAGTETRGSASIRHSVTFDNRGAVEQEAVTITYDASWGKRPCRVVMDARRSHRVGAEDSMGPWRIFCARATDATGGANGEKLTETARTRLSERHEPLVTEWLAGPSYEPSYKQALIGEMCSVALRMDAGRGTERFREVLAKYRPVLVNETYAALSAAADMYDAYLALVKLAGGPS